MQNKIDAIKNAVKPTVKDTVPEPVAEEMSVAGGVPANAAVTTPPRSAAPRLGSLTRMSEFAGRWDKTMKRRFLYIIKTIKLFNHFSIQYICQKESKV